MGKVPSPRLCADDPLWNSLVGVDKQWTEPYFNVNAFIQSALVGGQVHVAVSDSDPEHIIGVALRCVSCTVYDQRPR
jgi:hypothetical protein